jgi:sugar/nucleoside kinase (ribokinase family)
VGDDEYGRYVISQLQKYSIDTGKVRILDNAPTSFSDVMSLPSGDRTFFHARGANALFSPNDIKIKDLPCSMLHIGYILLLDSFDAADEEYGTVMARFLHEVQSAGIKTSIDMVSDNNADYSKTVLPALRYCNYVIVNELECCAIWKLNAYREDGSLDRDNLFLAMEKAIDAGVQDRVIVHCKKAAFIMDGKKNLTEVTSLKIPPEEIRGSVGAGDAFCAGCLYGITNNYGDKQLLEFASAAAACNLFSANSIDGMKPKQEILKMEEKYGRQ